MNIPYISKRLARRQIPDAWAFGLLKLLGRSNLAEVAPDKAWSKIKGRLDRLGIELAGRDVVEIGSGRYARLALQMLTAGVKRVTLADLYALDVNDKEQKSLLREDCVQLGLEWEEVVARVRVLTGDIISLPVPPVELRPDVVTSSAVLEHTLDPQRVLAACWAWLKPGGHASHEIDLRDHVFRSPFEMLTFSDDVWRRWLCPKRGFHLNRWRLPQYFEAMREAGFINIGYEVLQRDESGLRAILPRLDERFQAMDPDMLSVLVVHLYGQKPVCEGSDGAR
jgi:SAM-dependent methyltransferase